MRDQIRCRCPRCTIRGLMGPAVIITIGVLFLLNEMRGDLFIQVAIQPAAAKQGKQSGE